MGVFVGTATVGLVGSHINSPTLDTPASQAINVFFPVTFTNGSGTNQADTFVATNSSLTTGSTVSFDLYGGFDDAFGVSVTLAKVKGVFVRNRSTTVGENLILAGNFCSSSLALSSHTIKPSSVVCFIDPTGFTVTNSSADTITIQNLNATTVLYDFVVWGNL